MPSRASKPKRPRDVNQLAALIVRLATDPNAKAKDNATEPDTRNPHAVAMSKLGAAKGGMARAAKLSDKKRTTIAKKAAKARWNKRLRPSE